MCKLEDFVSSGALVFVLDNLRVSTSFITLAVKDNELYFVNACIPYSPLHIKDLTTLIL